MNFVSCVLQLDISQAFRLLETLEVGALENSDPPHCTCDVKLDDTPPTAEQETKQGGYPWPKIFSWCLHDNDLEHFIVFICVDTRIF